MALTPAQCRAARALVNWSQDQLQSASLVAKKTIADFERETRQPYDRTLGAIRTALEAAGVDFLEEDGGGPGVRLMQPFGRFRGTGMPGIRFELRMPEAGELGGLSQDFHIEPGAALLLGLDPIGDDAARVIFERNRRRIARVAIALLERLAATETIATRRDGAGPIRIEAADFL